MAETEFGRGMEMYWQYIHLTGAILSTGFYENRFSFLLIPYPFHHGRYDLLAL